MVAEEVQMLLYYQSTSLLTLGTENGEHVFLQ